MPKQVRALPVREEEVARDDESIPTDVDAATKKKDLQHRFITSAAEPEKHLHLKDGATMGMDGVVQGCPADVAGVAPDDQPGWSTRPPYVHDATREEPVNHFLSVVGRILDANKVPLNWEKLWKRSRKN